MDHGNRRRPSHEPRNSAENARPLRGDPGQRRDDPDQDRGDPGQRRNDPDQDRDPQQWFVGPKARGAHSSPPTQRRPRGDGVARWIRAADLDEFRDRAAHAGARFPERTVAPEKSRAARRQLAQVRQLDDTWLLIVVPTVWFTEDDQQVHTGRFAALISAGAVITLEVGEAHAHEDAMERLESVGPPHGDGTQRVVVAVLLAVVGGASDVELALGDAVADTEKLVFDARPRDPVQQIYSLKREIAEVRRALLPVSVELPELMEPSENIALDRRLMERVASTVERIDQHLDSHDGLLSDMLQAHLSQVSVRQNDDMRKISSWAAILVFPTIVAGIYGMNFIHMPELQWLVGYPLAILLMAIGCTTLYRVFRRSGWL